LEWVVDAVADLADRLVSDAADARRQRQVGGPDAVEPCVARPARVHGAVAPRSLGVLSRRRLRAVFGDRQAIPEAARGRWRALLEVRTNAQRLRLAWRPGGKCAYAWRHRVTNATPDLWYHSDAAPSDDCLDVETDEAEIVYLIRAADQWPA